ncbi:lytic transglycosylase domain-containing protein, partial [Dokdonella sp.]|uniref:lytic transglycosylase domain-containing protein n=1 Tax=Dokdonella sp. TaxID=2291710 RepID=UPI003C44BB8A
TVHADTLYKCEGPGGSVAYTNKKSAFTKCVAMGSYASAKPAPSSTQAKRSVEYQEKPDVRATSIGVTSTANLLAAPPIKPSENKEPKAAEPVARVMTSANTSKPAPKILRGAVYRVERSSGITEYTNVRPRDGRFAVLFTYISTCVACDVNSTINFSRTALNLDAFKDEVALAASDYGVDAALLRAVIHAESAFNPMAISAKGAQGLMQLMPGTASDLGVVDAFDVAENIRGGARYLAMMLKNFNGDERLATAAYNAGPGAVQKYSDVPPYAETQVYVERVAMLRDRYKKAL